MGSSSGTASVGPSRSRRRTTPRAVVAAIANTCALVCRHAGPPSTVRMSGMTLTSWATQAIRTRSACRSRLMRRLPTTSASVTSWVSSAMAGGSWWMASGGSAAALASCSAMRQTFHSSTLSPIRRREPVAAAVSSTMAPTASRRRRALASWRGSPRPRAIARDRRSDAATGGRSCRPRPRGPSAPTPRTSACGGRSPTGDQFHRRVDGAHRQRRGAGQAGVLGARPGPICHGPSISLPRHQRRMS